MPLQEDFFGTNTDASANRDYCKFCFQDGAFTLPDLTLQGMIERSVDFMTGHLKFSREDAERMSNEIIPTLKRWKDV